MKILLVVPPGEKKSKYSFLRFTAPPLGLAYIAAVLLENQFNRVQILDSNALSLTYEGYERILRQVQPDIVGIQTMTPDFYNAVSAAKIAKENGSNVVMGGQHATFKPLETLLHSHADYIVLGEGEDVFLSLVQAIEQGKDPKNLPGIAYLHDGKLVKNKPPSLRKNLDEFPFPARHLLPMNKYGIFGTNATTIISSRGCPFGCDFCAVTHYYGKKWRYRSPQNIVQELRELGNLKLNAAAFVDDLFFVSEKRVLQICREISKELDVELFWGATTRVDTVHQKTMDIMVKSGCRLAFVGVESGNQAALDSIHKKVTLDQVEYFFDKAREAKMDTLASFVYGLPGDTRSSIQATTDWVIKRLKPDLALFTVATPYPGTPFYENALQQGKIVEQDYSKYTLFQPIMEITGLKRSEVKELVTDAYKKFYIRPGHLIPMVKRELGYALESYGLGMFLRNGLAFGKAALSFSKIIS
ncbi:MAG: B12-binding domain-containing radical SAM protein [Promethearchaeota archaeon]